MSDYTPPRTWSSLVGRPYVTVSPSTTPDGSDYGAFTPGTTSSGIVEAYTSGAVYVHLLPGTFTFSATPDINQTHVKSVFLCGSGQGVTLIQAASDIDTSAGQYLIPMVAITSGLFIGIQHLSFVNPVSGVGAISFGCANAEPVDGFYVDDVGFVGAWTQAPIQNTRGEYTQYQAMRVQDCYFDSINSDCVDVQSSYNSNTYGSHFVMSGCTFKDIDGNPALAIYSSGATGTAPSVFIVESNTYIYTAGGGTVNPFVTSWFEADGQTLDTILIHDNVVQGAQCIFELTGNSGSYTGNVINKLQISGNAVSGLHQGAYVSSISAATVTNLSITNNIGYNPQGFGITTPSVPASGTAQENTEPFPVRVYLKTGGTGTAYAITDPAGNTETFTTTLAEGMEITLDPGASITLTYTVAPTWVWYGV